MLYPEQPNPVRDKPNPSNKANPIEPTPDHPTP